MNENVPGQNGEAFEMFQTLGLVKKSIDLIYTAFQDVDYDSSGLVTSDEILIYFESEENGSKFEKQIFEGALSYIAIFPYLIETIFLFLNVSNSTHYIFF